MLSKRGHQVFEASTGAEALRVLGENPAIALALCDLGLPDMDGERLVEAIRNAYPHVRILATSVFHQRLGVVCKEGVAHEKLLKPFGHRELLNALNQVMKGARAYLASA